MKTKDDSEITYSLWFLLRYLLTTHGGGVEVWELRMRPIVVITCKLMGHFSCYDGQFQVELAYTGPIEEEVVEVEAGRHAKNPANGRRLARSKHDSSSPRQKQPWSQVEPPLEALAATK
jgi:hypothetical protein